jgi:Zn-dependent protease with chaperone function
MKLLYSAFIALLFFYSAHSQSADFDNYQPLQSKGPLPVEFGSTSMEKYNSKKEEISTTEDKLERQAKDKYYLESAFGVDGILKNGKVLFNDTIGGYVTAVMQKVMDASDMQKTVRVYCIKSSEINAFATGEGVIFVTMGLMAYVKSEAQLAFILCHEYMHYICRHSVKGYIETKKILQGKDKFKNMSMEKKFLANQAFSREQESEADLKGVDLYLKSGYRLEEIDSAFEILRFSYLPFGMAKLDKGFIETQRFRIPDNYFLTTLARINDDDYDKALKGKPVNKKKKRTVKKDSTDVDDDGVSDIESTHPSIKKRINAIHEHIGTSSGEKVNFIISEEAFYYIRKIARYELVRLNLLNHSYERALYNAYNLLKEEPNSRYLKKCVLKALYGIAKFGNTGNLSMIHIKKKYAQGEWQQVPFLVSKMKGEGVSAWAIGYVWKLKKEYTDDPELKLIFMDLMTSMVEAHVKKKDDLIMRYEDTVNVGTRNRSLKPYIRLAFVDEFVNDPEFKEAYDYAFRWYSNRRNLRKKDKWEIAREKEDAKQRKKHDEDKIEESTREDIAIHWNEKLVKANKHYLDSGKLIILNPQFSYWVLLKDHGEYQYKQSEQGKIEMQESLKNIMGEIFPDGELISTPQQDETDQLNQTGLLYDWAIEKIENGKLNMVSVDYDRVQSLAYSKGAGNMVLLGVLSVKEKKTAGQVIFDLIVGTGIFPYYPLVLYQLATPSYTSNVYYITFNFKQDKIIYANTKLVHAKANKSFFNSQFYSLLLKLKKS